jgi:hypothetical protein
MPSLYVAYTAKKDGLSATGWATIRDCGEPQSTADIQALCKKLEGEGLTDVIPMYWKALAGM